MSTSERTRRLLEDAGALKRGHFVLSSGLHSDRYCQCATLFERPELAAQAAAMMRDLLPRGLRIDVVMSPALGGVLWGYELARVLGVRNIFAERQAGQPFELRRGFELRAKENVLLAEDVVTTGGSISELAPIVHAAGATVAAYAVIADRSRGAFKPGVPFFALTQLDFETYPPDKLPEHLRTIPAVKPGSRVKPGPPVMEESKR